MTTLEMRKTDGGKAATLELNDAVFAAETNVRTIRAAYNAYMANQRAGTHSVKTRNTVSGGGRKPYKQKGTGRARQGSIRATQWRGGGRVHGPQPRDHSLGLNRKEKRSALVGLLSSHVTEGTLTVVDSFALAAPKTKEFLAAVKSLGLDSVRRLLVITASTDESLVLAARNVQHIKVINGDNVNVFDLLTAYHVVITRDAAERLGRTWGAEA